MHLSYCTPDGTGTGTGTFTSFGRFGTMNARESDFPTHQNANCIFSHSERERKARTHPPPNVPMLQTRNRNRPVLSFLHTCRNKQLPGRPPLPPSHASKRLRTARTPYRVPCESKKKKKVHTTLSNACTITASGVATCALPDRPPLIPLPCMMHRRLCDFYSSLVEDSTRRHAQPFPAWLQKRGKF